jgi:hypothetical protein
MSGRTIGICVATAVLLTAGALLLWRTGGKITALRSMEAKYCNTPIRIDGYLNEEAWADAPWSDNFIFSGGRAPAPRRCRAKIMWSDEALFVGFEVEDSDLIAPHTRRDDPLYTQDVVELFLDPEGDGRDYIELEVSPRGTLFDARFRTYRSNLKRAKQYHAESFQAAVQLDGTLDGTGPDVGYMVEFRIDFSDIGVNPSDGDSWRINLFRIDKHGSEADYTAWTAPLVGDFHALDRFGSLVFRK